MGRKNRIEPIYESGQTARPGNTDVFGKGDVAEPKPLRRSVVYSGYVEYN